MHTAHLLILVIATTYAYLYVQSPVTSDCLKIRGGVLGTDTTRKGGGGIKNWSCKKGGMERDQISDISFNVGRKRGRLAAAACAVTRHFGTEKHNKIKLIFKNPCCFIVVAHVINDISKILYIEVCKSKFIDNFKE